MGVNLFTAAERGHYECLEALLEAGAAVNDRLQWSYDGPCVVHNSTALMVAAARGHKKCVDSLIKAGVDVNMMDNLGYMPLILAAEKDHAECIDALLQLGADVNKRSCTGWTALMGAAGCGDYTCVDILIQSGADVNSINCAGNTVLINEAGYGNSKCVKKLLLAGAKINQTIPDFFDNYNALDWSLRHNVHHREIVPLLYAAGEVFHHCDVPDYMKELNVEPSEMYLIHITREAIRKHLMDPYENLFHRVPRLGLPSALG